MLQSLFSCKLDSVMPSFQQFVTCHTRRQRTIDLCYGNVKDAYTSLPRPPLGRADHNVIQLLPKYRQLLKRVKPRLLTVRRWTDDAVESLRGCFDCTDWDLLSDPSDPLDTRVDVITDYMKFCLDNVIPHTVKKVYPNSKPWFTSHIHLLLKEKRQVFREKNLSKLDELNRVIRSEMRKSKLAYKEKVEEEFRSMNAKDAFQHVKSMAGTDNNSN